MPSPRCDWRCERCDERFELPVSAAACPICQGPLERLWDTPPHVSKGVAAFVDKLVEPQVRAREAIDPEKRTQVLPAQTVAGTLPGDAKLWSRSHALPVLEGLRGRMPRPTPP